jgi:hypothetical protein
VSWSIEWPDEDGWSWVRRPFDGYAYIAEFEFWGDDLYYMYKGSGPSIAKFDEGTEFQWIQFRPEDLSFELPDEAGWYWSGIALSGAFVPIELRIANGALRYSDAICYRKPSEFPAETVWARILMDGGDL